MLVVDWKRWLKQDKVKIWTVDPGFVATNLGAAGPGVLRSMGAGDPASSGVFLRDVVEGKRDEDVGKFINSQGILPY